MFRLLAILAAALLLARGERRAPGLDLADPGFDFSMLSEFRTRLVTGSCEQQILDTVLERTETCEPDAPHLITNVEIP
ncbi:hypothetical protein AB0K16_58745 [Nonomuraea jabiensis]|uniref:hypothetical protein n=1 Tax=Nonomuraea jabiensis TaxID=882448 RepID=UPI00343CD1A7